MLVEDDAGLTLEKIPRVGFFVQVPHRIGHYVCLFQHSAIQSYHARGGFYMLERPWPLLEAVHKLFHTHHDTPRYRVDARFHSFPRFCE